MDDLQVGDVVTCVVPSVRALCRLDRVEGLADRPVADRVEVCLEVVPVDPVDGLHQLLSSDEQDPRLSGRPPSLST